MPKTELKYNPVTGRVEQSKVEEKAGASSRGDYTTFLVTGDQLKTLVGFAKDDVLDMSTPIQRGKAINTYVRAAVEEFVVGRKKRVAALAAAPKK